LEDEVLKDRDLTMTFLKNVINGITDTHAHLCDPVFDSDRTEVLERAASVGIGTVIGVSEDMKDAKRNLALALKHPGLRPAAGLYPAYSDREKTEEMIGFIRENRKKLFAIGEVGLDFWVAKEESQRALQEDIFGMFIDLSLEVDLPLNVHSRSAGKKAIDLLIKHGSRRVQLHAFDGKASTALPAVECGFFFSIPPSIVRSRQKQKLLRQLPISSLLIETDSPVLGPSHGERNEPANAVVAVRAIAEIKGIAEREVVEAVTQNTLRLYGDIHNPTSSLGFSDMKYGSHKNDKP
jgi:TatD DNase family protein